MSMAVRSRNAVMMPGTALTDRKTYRYEYDSVGELDHRDVCRWWELHGLLTPLAKQSLRPRAPDHLLLTLPGQYSRLQVMSAFMMERLFRGLS